MSQAPTLALWAASPDAPGLDPQAGRLEGGPVLPAVVSVSTRVVAIPALLVAGMDEPG